MGLLKTAARAHVATRVVGSTHRRQQQRWAQQDAAAVNRAEQAAPAAAPVAPAQPVAAQNTSSMLDQLAQLGQLHQAGILTDAEFEVQKQRILAAG